MQKYPFRQKNAGVLLKAGCIIAAAIPALLIWGDVIRQMLLLLLGGGIIAFLLTPVSHLLEKKLSPALSAFLVLLLAAGLLLGAITFLLPALIRQLMQLSDLLPGALMRISHLLDAFSLRMRQLLPGAALPEIKPASLGGDFGDAARSAAATLASLADTLYRGFLMIVLSYFLISDRERILLRLELLVPLRWRRMAVRSGSELLRQMRMYLRGQATISLAVGLIASAAMFLLGLQGPLMLGFTVGICNVIPYFGPFLGGIPAVIAALSISWQRSLMTVLALFLVQQIDGLLISPRVMGGVTGFSPAVVLLALFAGARTGGIGGMLLALPLLMTIRTVYRVFVCCCEKN